MNILKTIENKLEDVFNIMAFLRTLVCIIFLICALSSCAVCAVEWAYSEASWVAHTIHFQENMDMPNCQWCIDYNTIIP